MLAQSGQFAMRGGLGSGLVALVSQGVDFFRDGSGLRAERAGSMAEVEGELCCGGLRVESRG